MWLTSMEQSQWVKYKKVKHWSSQGSSTHQLTNSWVPIYREWVSEREREWCMSYLPYLKHQWTTANAPIYTRAQVQHMITTCKYSTYRWNCKLCINRKNARFTITTNKHHYRQVSFNKGFICGRAPIGCAYVLAGKWCIAFSSKRLFHLSCHIDLLLIL